MDGGVPLDLLVQQRGGSQGGENLHMGKYLPWGPSGSARG